MSAIVTIFNIMIVMLGLDSVYLYLTKLRKTKVLHNQ